MAGKSEIQSSRTALLRRTLKLTACGAVVFALGFAIAVFEPDGSVAETHADISWFSSFERSNTERFESALERLGHDAPSRYNLNGNTVFFSTNTSRKSPREVMAEYQEEFQRQGLNDRVHLDLRPDTKEARVFTSLTGGLSPISIGERQVLLGGVVTANRATTPQELMQNYRDADGLEELFRAHRYIEISRPAGSRHTSIVSSWSDEAFDYKKMRPGQRAEGQIYDDTLPPCPGCTRLTRFADDDPSTPARVDLAYVGPQSLELTRSFYLRTLAEAGWKRAESAGIEEIQQWVDIPAPTGESMVLHRGGQELTLIFMPDYRRGETLTLGSYTGN